MIILLNGPFGIGKTSTANALVRLNPSFILFDPEIIGGFLRRLLGSLANAADFQDLPLWRSLTVGLAMDIHREYGRHLVIPMTIWRRDYFEEIAGGLATSGIDLHCLSLVAARETAEARILARPEHEGGHDWCLRHLGVALAAANDPAFGHAIVTDDLTPEQVARQILQRIASTTP